METTACQETRSRGTFEFPVEFHYVDSRHPRYQMPLHWHVECELILVLQGSLLLRLNESRIEMHAGDVVLVPSGVLHGGLPTDCIYECFVYEQERFLAGVPAGGAARRLLGDGAAVQPFHAQGGPVSHMADRLFETMESQYAGYELVAQGLLLQLYGTLLRYHLYDASNPPARTDKKLQPLKNALRLIRESFAQPLTLAELAGAAGMSPRYFCRYFQSLTQKTPIEYLNYYRIESACEQLLTSEDSITDIAFNCGFNDVSYFIKIFHRYKGVSPRQFRRAG